MIEHLRIRRPARAVIIGGGITGLSAAYYLQETARQTGHSIEITVLEAKDRLGGKIQTEYIDGFRLEAGPDCFLRQKPWAAQLVQALGLQEQLIGTNDYQRKVYVLNRGRLAQLPDGVMLIIPTRIIPFALSPLISISGKIRMGMDLLIKPFAGNSDESIADFVRRRLGREALDKIAEPLLSGIHVSDPERQSLLGTFPRFRALEQKHGSLIKGMLAERRLAKKRPPSSETGPSTLFLSLRNGLGQLVEGLIDHLDDVNIRTNCPVESITRAQDGYHLSLAGGQQIEADAVLLATQSDQAACLLEAVDPDLADELAKIRFVSTATISLAYREQDLRNSLRGFGFVIPRREKRDITACTWTSYKFDHRSPAGTVLIRCFVGGPGREEMVSLPDVELLEIAKRELRSIMALDAEPVLFRIYRWEKANPQYDVHHLERVATIFQKVQKYPGMLLAGGSYEGVGVPDCVRQGQKAALKAFEFLSNQKEVV